MPTVLLTATPLLGHVNPMLTLGRGLAERGYRVLVLTGRQFAGSAAEAGLELLPLPPASEITPPPGPRPRNRVAAAREDIVSIFIDPLTAQHAALTTALARHDVDAVLSDTAFLGALPLARRDPATRPPVLGVSMTPLSLISVDCAPFGSGMAPGSSWFTRMRNVQVNWLLHHGPLKTLHDRLDAELVPHGVPPRSVNFFDQARAYDLTFHLGLAEMEYTRREMPGTIRFVGPVRARPSDRPLPSWWGELDGDRPVVHVTQGTLDNADLGKLLAPAVRALADEDVLVVVSTGGRPVADLERELAPQRLPANVRVSTFLPYDRLLPRTDVMVTNGGHGGVQDALRHGVPLVVAGETEDKPEVAARAAWAGVGRNLRSGRPSPARVRAAVRDVLGDPRYRRRAQEMARAVAALPDPVDTVDATVREQLRRRSRSGPDVRVGMPDGPAMSRDTARSR